MKYIGLLMVNEENDILARTLNHNASLVDVFYALDGTANNALSKLECESHRKCVGYFTDEDLPRPQYPDKACDGYRQFLLEKAVHEFGWNNWFVLLHADEVWTDYPSEISRTLPPCGVVFNLPFFFPREGEPWQYGADPIDQLHWHFTPGWPELRMFHGGPEVRYDRAQHFDVTPQGLRTLAYADQPILHYPFRSPDQQAKRAQVTFDPDNYRRIGYWTDAMIEEQMKRPQFRELRSTMLVEAS